MHLRLRNVIPFTVVAEKPIDNNQWPNFLVITTGRFSRYIKVAYLDTKEYKADMILIRHKVRVKFLRDFLFKGSEHDLTYSIVKVRKADFRGFIESMRELRNAHLILGNQEYARIYLAWRVNYKDMEFYLPGDLPRRVARKAFVSLIGDGIIGRVNNLESEYEQDQGCGAPD